MVSTRFNPIHGYASGAVTVTTALLLSHQHPGDQERLATMLDRIKADHTPLSSRHRIFDTDGVEHSIVIVGDLLHHDTGAVIETQESYIDVTASGSRTQQRITLKSQRSPGATK
jgi:hypothetical protein